MRQKNTAAFFNDESREKESSMKENIVSRDQLSLTWPHFQNFLCPIPRNTVLSGLTNWLSQRSNDPITSHQLRFNPSSYFGVTLHTQNITPGWNAISVVQTFRKVMWQYLSHLSEEKKKMITLPFHQIVLKVKITYVKTL